MTRIILLTPAYRSALCSEQIAGDRSPDELGGVVEGPPELDLARVARHAAHDVHPLVLGHAVDDGLGCCTNRNI